MAGKAKASKSVQRKMNNFNQRSDRDILNQMERKLRRIVKSSGMPGILQFFKKKVDGVGRMQVGRGSRTTRTIFVPVARLKKEMRELS